MLTCFLFFVFSDFPVRQTFKTAAPRNPRRFLKEFLWGIMICPPPGFSTFFDCLHTHHETSTQSILTSLVVQGSFSASAWTLCWLQFGSVFSRKSIATFQRRPPRFYMLFSSQWANHSLCLWSISPSLSVSYKELGPAKTAVSPRCWGRFAKSLAASGEDSEERGQKAVFAG